MLISRPPEKPANARGFSLIEALIAVAVLAIGLLAVAALQIQGVRQNFDSQSRSQAVTLMNDYVERIYANRVRDPGDPDATPPEAFRWIPGLHAGFDSRDLTGGDGTCSSPPEPLCGTEYGVEGTVCTPEEMVTYDQYIISCGYASSSGRQGGIGDSRLLLQGNMQVVCLDPLGAEPCPPGGRLQITMSWIESELSVEGGALRSERDDNAPDAPDDLADLAGAAPSVLVVTVRP